MLCSDVRCDGGTANDEIAAFAIKENRTASTEENEIVKYQHVQPKFISTIYFLLRRSDRRGAHIILVVMSLSARPPRHVAYRLWHMFDATNVPVGRLAARVARLLSGKHKPTYTPQVDDGDSVVIVNARAVSLSGNKWRDKVYKYHTGYVGGLKSISAKVMRETHPTKIISHAVKGMIHHNRHRIPRLRRLHIYEDEVHPHSAQFAGIDVLAYTKQVRTARQAAFLEGVPGQHDIHHPQHILTDEEYANLRPSDPEMLAKYEAHQAEMNKSRVIDEEADKQIAEMKRKRQTVPVKFKGFSSYDATRARSREWESE